MNPLQWINFATFWAFIACLLLAIWTQHTIAWLCTAAVMLLVGFVTGEELKEDKEDDSENLGPSSEE